MASDFSTLIRSGQKGVVFDTNLLLLHLLGNYDQKLIKSHKRLTGFSFEDLNILAQILEINPRLAVTPHILTEVCNLSDTDNKRSKFELFSYFRDCLRETKERRQESEFLMERPAFIEIGLADCSLVDASRSGYTVITKDVDCYLAIQKVSGRGINFAHIQAALWFSGR